MLSQERLLLLQKMVEEHQMFQSQTQRFQSWLRLKTKDLADLMEKKNLAEDKLEALQVRVCGSPSQSSPSVEWTGEHKQTKQNILQTLYSL